MLNVEIPIVENNFVLKYTIRHFSELYHSKTEKELKLGTDEMCCGEIFKIAQNANLQFVIRLRLVFSM